jgi:ParB/RepB/Spo0J family partition protein
MNAPTAPTAETAAEAIDFCFLPVDQLEESQHNTRTHYDADKLAELAASFKDAGVLEPLIVRPARGAPDELRRFEIIAGSRRFRAAKLAKLAQMPVMIRQLTDAQALRVTLIENAQREDVRPLDEAHAFAKLMDKKLMGAEAMTAEQIADRIGKSREHVWHRLKLLEASAPVQKALSAGKIKIDQAVLLARLPENDQKEGLHYATDDFNPYSVKELRNWANERDNAAKRRARVADEIKNAEQNGHKIVKLLEYDMGRPPAGCLTPANYLAAGKIKCENLALGFFVHRDGDDYTGRNLKVCIKPAACPQHKKARDQARRHDRDIAQISRTGRSLAEEKKRKASRQAADHAITAIAQKTTALGNREHRIIFDALLNRLWHDHAKAIARRHLEWDASKKARPEELIQRAAAKATPADRDRLLLELALQVNTGWDGTAKNIAGIASEYGIDVGKLQTQALNAGKPKMQTSAVAKNTPKKTAKKTAKKKK